MGASRDISDEMNAEGCRINPYDIGVAPQPHLIEHWTAPQHDWRVEAIVEDGAIEQAIFIGPDAEARAREYLGWRYPKGMNAKNAALQD